jgi:hypothetical protein
METKTKTVWEFLELPKEHAPQAQALYEWGRNCNRSGNPFLHFLDLIGWTEDNYGEGQKAAPAESSYGYVELEYLSDALTEYINDPCRALEWIDELMTKEGA